MRLSRTPLTYYLFTCLDIRDGPVFNIDDDAKFVPELLRRVWRVKRAMTWPVGNLGPACTYLPSNAYHQLADWLAHQGKV